MIVDSRLTGGARALAVLAALSVCAALHAQNAGPAGDRNTSQALLQQQRTIDEKLARERKELAPINALIDWQWGGWIEYYVFQFNDGIQSDRIYQRPSLVLWTRMRADEGAHEIFARMRMSYDRFDKGDEYDRLRDWVGPNLDRGWYQIDVGRAFRLTTPADPFQLKFKVGRQEVRYGAGYALDLPLDSITMDARLHDFRIKGLFGKTIGSFPHLDRSVPSGTPNAHRMFGVQVSYDGFEHHTPFAYAIWNDDYSDERPADGLQNYAYDTEYFGLGSTGNLTHNLAYWTEWVYESGEGYSQGMFRRRTEIDAWAFDVGLEYRWDHKHKPRVAFEYMFASGDRDRIFSPTNAVGGNPGDRKDSSFAGYGFRDTGLAAAPFVSNIHIWRAGGSCMPFVEHELFREFELGTNWFLYHKHHRRAAISDSTAGEFEGYVGWEMDYFVNWRFANDLAWTMRWGMFFPGDAFEDQSARSFLFTGLTWSF